MVGHFQLINIFVSPIVGNQYSVVRPCTCIWVTAWALKTMNATCGWFRNTVVVNNVSVIHPLICAALESKKSMNQSANTYTFIYDRERYASMIRKKRNTWLKTLTVRSAFAGNDINSRNWHHSNCWTKYHYYSSPTEDKKEVFTRLIQFETHCSLGKTQ